MTRTNPNSTRRKPKKKALIHLLIEKIVIPRGRRPIDTERRDALAESIKEIGLETPITVRKVKRKLEGEMLNVWELVAGHHRIAAFKKLGIDPIDAFVFEGDDVDAMLWEVAENLHRAELTYQQRADEIAKWVGAVKAKGGRSAPTNAVAKVAKALRVDKSQVKKAVKVAKLPPGVRAAADEAGLNGRDDRLAIARTPLGQQLAKVAELAEAKAAPKPTNPLTELWSRVSDDTRREFAEAHRETFLSLLAHRG